MAIYRVTATLLNLRQAADRASNSLAKLKTGTIVTGLADATPAAGWVRVGWSGLQGYVSSLHLETIAGSAAASDFGPAPNVERRDVEPARLHPTVRAKVATLLSVLHGKSMPFRVFEGFRTPERQRHLYAQGRSRPGAIVTKAEAWESYHQYGLAVDLVLFVDGNWSWNTSGAFAPMWTTMHAEARVAGLEPLSFERPHVQLMGFSLSQLRAGSLPPGGDASWRDALSEAAARWTANGGTPPAPPGLITLRPPLDEQA